MRDRLVLAPGAPPGLPASFAAAWSGLRGVTVDRNRRRHVERVDLGGTVVYAKFFHRPGPADLLRNLLTAPRALSQGEREWRMARRLRAAGLATVAPLAFGDRRLGPLERQSLFVSLAEPGPTLGERIRGAEPGALAPAVAKLIGALLRAGLHLPDLSTEHILLGPGDRLVLLDLHNGRACRPRPGRVGRMLGRLWAGARDAVPPGAALHAGCRALRGILDRRGRRAALAAAARHGERWERRERRKRRPGEPG